MSGQARWAAALLFCLILSPGASAETVAQTARQWGLIGLWSRDCSLAPDRDRGTVLSYEVAPDGRLLHRRNFGNGSDESEIVAAGVSRDGMLNLRVLFPKLKQTREYGLMKQPDGTMRAIFNRDHRHRYTIQDGKYGDGRPTPSQHKCG